MYCMQHKIIFNLHSKIFNRYICMFQQDSTY